MKNRWRNLRLPPRDPRAAVTHAVRHAPAIAALSHHPHAPSASSPWSTGVPIRRRA